MKRIASIIILAVIVLPFSNAQHGGPAEGIPNTSHEGVVHKVTLMMANSFLENQVDENTNNVMVVPTYGLNYDVLFHHKWGAGLHSDVVLQQFKVERHEGHEELIRENPVALCVVGLFKALPPLTLIAGYGVEFEKHENIQLFRIGVEYGFHLPGNWELEFALEFDRKFNTYNSWVFGVGFCKLFMK